MSHARPIRHAPSGARSSPSWEALPGWLRQDLVALERWALNLDGAPRRCPRRDCRKAGACHARDKGAEAACQGAPSAAVEPMVEGMWLAHCRRFEGVLDWLQEPNDGERPPLVEPPSDEEWERWMALARGG